MITAWHLIGLLGAITSPIAVTVLYLAWAKKRWRWVGLLTFAPVLIGVEWLFLKLMLWPQDANDQGSVGDGFVILPCAIIALTMILIYYGIALADGISRMMASRSRDR